MFVIFCIVSIWRNWLNCYCLRFWCLVFFFCWSNARTLLHSCCLLNDVAFADIWILLLCAVTFSFISIFNRWKAFARYNGSFFNVIARNNNCFRISVYLLCLRAAYAILIVVGLFLFVYCIINDAVFTEYGLGKMSRIYYTHLIAACIIIVVILFSPYHTIYR